MVVDESVDKVVFVDDVCKIQHEREIILPKNLQYRVYTQSEAAQLASTLEKSPQPSPLCNQTCVLKKRILSMILAIKEILPNSGTIVCRNKNLEL